MLDLPSFSKLENWTVHEPVTVSHRKTGSQDVDPWEKRVTWGETHFCPSFLLERIPCSLHSLPGVPGRGACYNMPVTAWWVSRVQGCWRGCNLYGRLLGRRELWEGNPEAEMCIRTGRDLAERSCAQAGKRMAIARFMQYGEKWRAAG